MKKLIQRLLLGTALATMLAGCEKDSGEDQFVSPGTADVRGTWYKHGNSGGWYGPNKEWGFGWFYLEQYGTNVQGKYDNELYAANDEYDSLRNVVGTITGNRLSVSAVTSEGVPIATVNATVSGNRAGRLEKASSEIDRWAMP